MPINLKRSIEYCHRRGSIDLVRTGHQSIALQNRALPECRKYNADFIFLCSQSLDKMHPESYDWSTDWVGRQKPTK
ncbi:hypothetical protein NDI47_13375 [Microcoleus vaginatus GB1-A2]|uniref:hypothetical protein n=1 Tax=Microcoleus vaginatus TaxID=119532 RepID=UPI001686F9FA|nr:hypothetical protein [Microcoleus sp. FACHB-61]